MSGDKRNLDCKFPFRYEGKEYQTCISKSDDSHQAWPWCPIEKNADISDGWMDTIKDTVWESKWKYCHLSNPEKCFSKLLYLFSLLKTCRVIFTALRSLLISTTCFFYINRRSNKDMDM